MDLRDEPGSTHYDRLLTMREAAGVLGIPMGTLESWRHRGVGPVGAKIGGRVRYREADVLGYIESAFVREQSRRETGGTRA